jgi:tetratricopeptide (TPR) repeat protein
MRTAFSRGSIIAVLVVAALLSGCMSKSEKLVFGANEKAKKAMQSDPATKKKLLDECSTDLQQAVTLDSRNLDAWKLKAQVDEVLGRTDDAAKDYEEASALDPTDQNLLQKARLYKGIEDLINSAGRAVDEIKAGQVAEGMQDIKAALLATKTPTSRDKVTKALAQALPFVAQQADQQAQQKKYQDALKNYDLGVRGYMLLAEAQHQQKLDPGADAMLHSINEAAKDAGTPDATFRILNDVLGMYPDNKVANMELAQVYLRRSPPDYTTAADLEERAGAPDAEVKKLRDQAKRQRKHRR